MFPASSLGHLDTEDQIEDCEIIAKYLYWWGNLELPDFVKSKIFRIRTTDVIYYYVIWTDNKSMLPEANTWRQGGKYLMIEVLQGCILKLSLH